MKPKSMTRLAKYRARIYFIHRQSVHLFRMYMAFGMFLFSFIIFIFIFILAKRLRRLLQ